MTYGDLERSHEGHPIAIAWNWCSLDTSLVRRTYRKPYTYYTLVTSDLTYGDLERSHEGHLIFNVLLHENGAV